MGEIVDLEAYRAAQRRRQRDEAKRRERGRALAERSDTAKAKPDAEPAKDDPA